MSKGQSSLSKQLTQAELSLQNGDFGTARNLLLELHPLCEGYQAERAKCSNVLAFLGLQLGRYDEGLAFGLEAQELIDYLPKNPQISLHINIGLIYSKIGDRFKSLDYYLNALSLAQKVGSKKQIFLIFNNLGYKHILEEKPKRALEYLEKAKDYVNNNAKLECLYFRNSSQAYIDLNQLDIASNFAEQALSLAQQQNYTLVEGYALYSLAQISRKHKAWDKAHELYQAALKAHNHDGYLTTQCLLEIADCYRTQGNLKEAVSSTKKALNYLKEQNQTFPLLRCYETLYQVYEEMGDIAKALSYHKQLHDLHKQAYNEQNEMRIRVLDVEHRTKMLHQETDLLKQKNEELEQLNQTIKEISIRDELSGLYNRRYLFEQAEILVKSAQRYKRPLSVAMLDIDHFKQVNDTFGHKIGDDVIKQVATILKDTLREVDLLARYGGEEFAVLLPETPLPNAVRACERLRDAVEIFDWSTLHSDLSISISVGVTMQAKAESCEALLSQADEKLYQAKRSGRNRVCSASLEAVLTHT